MPSIPGFIISSGGGGGGVDDSREIIAGAGLTGGGDLSADRTLAVGAGAGLTVAADSVSVSTGGVTLAMLADLATDRIIGRSTAGTGAPEAIVCGAAGRALLDDADAAAQRVTLDAQQDVFTSRGDLVRAGPGGVAERLPLGAAGTIPRSDGTDIAYTTLTIPTTAARGTVLAATGTNAITAVAASAADTFVGGDGTDVGPRTATQVLASLYPTTLVSLASATGWTTRNGEGGSGTSAVNTGTQSLDLACTSAGSQVYTTIGRAPWSAGVILDLRSRVSAFSSALVGDTVLMFMCDALAASITLGIQIAGNDACTAFSSSGNPASTVIVAGAGGGEGWLRLVVMAGLQAAAYVGVGVAGAEPTSWTSVGYVQLATGGRVAWPFVAWQLNRNAGSGNVSATVDSIRYTVTL